MSGSIESDDSPDDVIYLPISPAVVDQSADVRQPRVIADYPMWVLPVSYCMYMDRLEPHQVLVKKQRVIEWDGVGNVLFVSHQWCGDQHPDPHFEQFRVLQDVLTNLAKGETYVDSDMKLQILGGAITITGPEWATLLNARDTYIWYDYMSCPQPTAAKEGDTMIGKQLMAAINSIPSYVSRCTYQIVLCPPVQHADRPGTICDQISWTRRGWCRLEAVCHLLHVGGGGRSDTAQGSASGLHGSADNSHRGRPQMLIEGVTPEAIRFRPPYDTMTAPVGTGVFTVESDRAKLADVVEQVIDTTLETARTQGDLFIFRWFLAARHFYLKGLPAVKYAEDELSTWEDFRAAYAFETPHDDDRGYTPLRYAALSNNVAVVRELIEVHGADIHLQASKEAVPLFGTLGGEDILGSVMQICGGHKDAKPMIALLLSKGADPHRPSSGAGHGLVVAASFGNVDAATALLKLAPSMREGVPTMPFLFTPLNMACINNKSDFVQWLIENDLATDTCNLFGHAAFHASALQGDVDCMRLMVTCLKLKENINIISTPQRFLPANLIHNVTKVAYRCGVRARPVTWFSESIFATPLHCAANSNRISVLAYLLSAGADPTVLNGVGHTAIETARRHGHRDAAAIIEAWPNAPTQGRFDVGSGLPSAPTEGRNTREKVTDTLDLSC